ncbi:MAG: competence/damage-inducible protein A [Planctomycetes bacterium]|nr:competence/damage-inducible protein A [Planctomycetota bacterium]
MRRAWIISIGTELTLGQSVDTNSAWLSQQLAALGIRVERHVTIADEHAPLVDVLRQSAGSSDLVVVTGGLGPTDDDLTRAALAEAANTRLERDQAALERIRAFFAKRNRPMPERNCVQADVPIGGRSLPNDRGTAPGVFIAMCGTAIYALPGVPFEMKAMFEAQVAPEIRTAAKGRVVRSRVVRTFGRPESEIGEQLSDLMARGRNPEVGTTADMGDIGVRINAIADSAEACDALLEREEREVRRRLGPAVYGRDADTLAVAVGRMLAERGQTVSVAESCTGGMLGAILTDVPGSSRYFLGGVIAYANEVKIKRLDVPAELLRRHGAVSEETAAAMAAGARAAFESTYALATTGVAGPDGGSPEKPVGMVCFGIAGPASVRARTIRYGETLPRGVIRHWAARTALNLLRMELG